MLAALLLGAVCVLWGLCAPVGADEAPRLDETLKVLAAPGTTPRRLAAANDLVRLGQRAAARPRVVAMLARLLQDVDPALRRAAANGLSRLDAREQAPAVRQQLGLEADLRVRPALLLALGRLGTAQDVPRIAGYARHTVPAVRAAALMALGVQGGEGARSAVRHALADASQPDPQWVVRAAAFVALSEIGTAEDVPRAQRIYVAGEGFRHFAARSAWVRLVAAKAADPRALLRDFLGDPDGRVAVTAAKGLARRGHGAMLIAILDERGDAGRRAAAVVGLGTLPGEEIRARLVRQVQRDPARTVRWVCARTLFERGDPEGDALVLRGLGAREPAVWTEAMALLEERTGEQHRRDAKAWEAALLRWRARTR